MNLIPLILIAGLIVSWFKNRKISGMSDHDFIKHITDDEKANKLIDKLETSRTLNRIAGYLFILSCIICVYSDKSPDNTSSAVFVAFFIGFGAISIAQSHSDDSKTKLIYLARSLKQNKD